MREKQFKKDTEPGRSPGGLQLQALFSAHLQLLSTISFSESTILRSVRARLFQRLGTIDLMSIRTNLLSIHERIEVACTSVGRDPSGVTLIAVTKTQSIDAIREAYD